MSDPSPSNPSSREGWFDHLKFTLAMLGGLALPGCIEERPEPPRPPGRAARLDDWEGLTLPQRRVRAGEDAITAELVRKHIEFLAHDDTRGRASGAGILEGRVSEYVEKAFREAGLTPFATAGKEDFRQAFDISTGRTHNLVALLPGSDPELAGEYLVIGAHMDHIGTRAGREGADNIFNGADDNASGTSAVMAVAAALAKAKSEGIAPRRSVIVVLFSGEEMGLLGSRHFVENPPVPLSQIKGMINMDMVGRLDRGQLSITDVTKNGQSSFFHDLHDAEGLGFVKISHDVDDLVAYSDGYPFYQKGIPLLDLFEGLTPDRNFNPDYHRVSDHADKIDFDKVAAVARFAYRHLVDAANRDAEKR